MQQLIELYKIELNNGETYYYTTADHDVSWDQNYVSVPAQRDVMTMGLNLESDATTIYLGNISGDLLDAVSRNVLTGAKVTIYLIKDDGSPYSADDTHVRFIGLADIEYDRVQLTLHLRSVLDGLNLQVPRHIYGESCNHRLYDVNCGKDIDDYDYDGTFADQCQRIRVLDETRGTIYKVDFDAGDSSSPISVGDTIGPPQAYGPGNDFSGDSSCRSQWRFESGALETDSKGTNHWTNAGVVASNTYVFEGSWSAYTDHTEMNLADADLDSGHPWKSTTPSGTFTLMGRWLSPDQAPYTRDIIRKYETGVRSWDVYLGESGGVGKLNFWYSTDGSTFSIISHDFSFTRYHWYSFVVRYDEGNEQVTLSIRDETTLETWSTTYDLSGPVAHTTSKVQLADNQDYGRTQWIDEIVVFNRLLSDAEVETIWDKNYPTVNKRAVVCHIKYATATSGTIWYCEQSGTQFADDDVLQDSDGNSVTVNGTPAEDLTLYEMGELYVTSGQNAGQRRPIMTTDSNGWYYLAWPLMFAPAFGDTYKAYPGCDLSKEICESRWSNIGNFRGFPDIPKWEDTAL